METTQAPLMNTYKRSNVTFISGNGCYLYDQAGKRYLDCLAGIAVVSCGHANKTIAASIAEQAKKLVHVSNLYYTQPMAELSYKLKEITGGWGQVFYGNSGAEANECAIKLARKKKGPKQFKIICAEGGFHGRTLATLAATGQPSKWKGFEPLPYGFEHAEYNNLESFADKVEESTAAIFVEPILGERGIIPAEKSFIEGLRKLCDEKHLLLIFDEVQAGMGRTGTWWAFQNYGVEPDIFTSAKALANGLPIGACIAKEDIADAFKNGDHGSTFGGGPVVCKAALAAIKFIENEGLLENAKENGKYLEAELQKLPHVTATRGMGLMLAAVLDSEKSELITASALTKGLIVNNVAQNVIRFTPPLIITKEQIKEACQILGQAIEEVYED